MFYETMRRISRFHVEDGVVPQFEATSTKEFAELNATLTRILSQSVRSYQVQKQFTENASHELQTPLAVIQGKLDLLLQDPNLTDRQALLMQDIYHEVNHISQLNRNLLLLARIENAQYQRADRVVLSEKINILLPSLQILAGDLAIRTHMATHEELTCNEVLLESMLRNFVVNAVRHNHKGGEITIKLDKDRLTIVNTSDEPALDASRIFERFYQSGSARKGNGLGLAIVKSICDYHGWTVAYSFEKGCHLFSVAFA